MLFSLEIVAVIYTLNNNEIPSVQGFVDYMSNLS